MRPTASRRETIAAPPDDGGHHGSFTLPEDELQVDPMDDSRHPELSRDPAHPPPSRRGARGVTWTLLLLLLAGTVLWQYCGAAQPNGALGHTPPNRTQAIVRARIS